MDLILEIKQSYCIIHGKGSILITPEVHVINAPSVQKQESAQQFSFKRIGTSFMEQTLLLSYSKVSGVGLLLGTGVILTEVTNLCLNFTFGNHIIEYPTIQLCTMTCTQKTIT